MKSGYLLLRKIYVIITWEKYFVVLRDDNILLLFKTEDVAQVPVDIVYLDEASTLNRIKLITFTEKKYTFEISTRGTSFLFCSSTEEELESWLQATSQILENIPKTNNTANSSSSSNNNSNNSNFVLCSYNVNFGLCIPGPHNSEAESIEVIAMLSTKADVILLQETTEDWENYIKFRTGVCKEYHYSAFHHFETNSLPAAGGIAIISKFPFTEKELIPSPVGWFPAFYLVVHLPHQDVQVLNLHLRPPLTASTNPLPLPHVYISSQQDRVIECMFYAKYVDFRAPLVVVGDFNEDTNANSVKVWTKKLALQNAYDKLEQGVQNRNPQTHITKEDKITWQWNLPLNITLKAKFDHIFYHKLQCEGYDVKLAGVSDHFPIFAKFSYPHK